jgi:serine/threonine transporter
LETTSIWNRIASGNLIVQIFIGIVAAIVLVVVSRESAASAILLGNLFVGALKAVAPVLVLVLVASALANQKESHTAQMRPIVGLYLVGTFSAALLAVAMSKLFPTTLTLIVTDTDLTPPQGIAEVLNTLLFKIVDNPITAIATANYIGILVWGVALGLFLRQGADST